MSDSASPSALHGRPSPAAYKVMAPLAWLSASLATAVAIYLLAGLVLAANTREAEQISDAAGAGRPYLALVIGAFAARQGRSDRYR